MLLLWRFDKASQSLLSWYLIALQIHLCTPILFWKNLWKKCLHVTPKYSIYPLCKRKLRIVFTKGQKMSALEHKMKQCLPTLGTRYGYHMIQRMQEVNAFFVHCSFPAHFSTIVILLLTLSSTVDKGQG